MHFRKSKAKRFIIMKLLGGEWEEWAHFASEVKARREWAAPGGYATRAGANCFRSYGDRSTVDPILSDGRGLPLWPLRIALARPWDRP